MAGRIHDYAQNQVHRMGEKDHKPRPLGPLLHVFTNPS